MVELQNAGVLPSPNLYFSFGQLGCLRGLGREINFRNFEFFDEKGLTGRNLCGRMMVGKTRKGGARCHERTCLT